MAQSLLLSSFPSSFSFLSTSRSPAVLVFPRRSPGTRIRHSPLGCRRRPPALIVKAVDMPRDPSSSDLPVNKIPAVWSASWLVFQFMLYKVLQSLNQDLDTLPEKAAETRTSSETTTAEKLIKALLRDRPPPQNFRELTKFILALTVVALEKVAELTGQRRQRETKGEADHESQRRKDKLEEEEEAPMKAEEEGNRLRDDVERGLKDRIEKLQMELNTQKDLTAEAKKAAEAAGKRAVEAERCREKAEAALRTAEEDAIRKFKESREFRNLIKIKRD